MVLPIPVAGLDPLLNGRNLQLRLRSSGPVYLATLATQGNNDDAPTLTRWQELLRSGRLSPKEHTPTPRGSRGKMIYSRVSGIQVGSRWAATITDPGTSTLSLPQRQSRGQSAAWSEGSWAPARYRPRSCRPSAPAPPGRPMATTESSTTSVYRCTTQVERRAASPSPSNLRSRAAADLTVCAFRVRPRVQ